MTTRLRHPTTAPAASRTSSPGEATSPRLATAKRTRALTMRITPGVGSGRPTTSPNTVWASDAPPCSPAGGGDRRVFGPLRCMIQKMMLTWIYQLVPQGTRTWYSMGGDAMAVISSKPHGFELIAWWVQGGGNLTPKKSPVFATLEEAQAEADRLVFSRIDNWSRLLEE